MSKEHFHSVEEQTILEAQLLTIKYHRDDGRWSGLTREAVLAGLGPSDQPQVFHLPESLEVDSHLIGQIIERGSLRRQELEPFFDPADDFGVCPTKMPYKVISRYDIPARGPRRQLAQIIRNSLQLAGIEGRYGYNYSPTEEPVVHLGWALITGYNSGEQEGILGLMPTIQYRCDRSGNLLPFTRAQMATADMKLLVQGLFFGTPRFLVVKTGFDPRILFYQTTAQQAFAEKRLVRAGAFDPVRLIAGRHFIKRLQAHFSDQIGGLLRSNAQLTLSGETS